MKYSFRCFGHENIRAKHHKTIEFTKSSYLTPRGTCIIGIRADFDVSNLNRLSNKIKITVKVNEIIDIFFAKVNPNFNDDHEIVFRKSNYHSKRTLGFNLNKGAKDLNRDIIKLMQNPNSIMEVTLEESR